jgi:hypothetical protein
LPNNEKTIKNQNDRNDKNDRKDTKSFQIEIHTKSFEKAMILASCKAWEWGISKAFKLSSNENDIFLTVLISGIILVIIAVSPKKFSAC